MSFAFYRSLLVIFGLCVPAALAHRTVYQNLLDQDNFYTGIITAHRVLQPTQAALDMAAWYHNGLFGDPGGSPEIKVPAYRLTWNDLFAKGTFSRIEDRITAIGLSDKSRLMPLSFPAVKREAQIQLGWSLFAEIQAAIDEVGGIRATRLFIQSSPKKLPWNKKGLKPNLWIEIEMMRGTEIEGVHDNNGDGIPEVYVQVNPAALRINSLRKFESWAIGKYAGKVLEPNQILEWAQVLASYWYPALNTDLVWNIPKNKKWPYLVADSIYLKALGGRAIRYPTIVIRGNPMGTPHYTIIEVPGLSPLAQLGSEPSEKGLTLNSNKRADRNLPENYVRNMERFENELSGHGGSYWAWDSSLLATRTIMKKALDTLPIAQMGFEGQNAWLFFKRSLAYTVGGDISAQEAPYAPMPHLNAFKTKLEDTETNMLFVPVPPKTEVYPEHLPLLDASVSASIVNPWGRKILREAQEEGIEVMDLLPLYLQARSAEGEPLYQLRDTHWTRRGMMVAAQAIADRIKQYDWYADLKPDTSRFKVRDTVYTRLGDLVERLPTDRQAKYPADTLAGSRVFVQDSVPYKGEKGSPIIIIGDSFTGVMELVDCKNGGVASHIARLTGLDVELITSWGGGPNVRSRLLKSRQEQLLQNARLVVYLMAARDLYGYPEGWEPEN